MKITKACSSVKIILLNITFKYHKLVFAAELTLGNNPKFNSIPLLRETGIATG